MEVWLDILKLGAQGETEAAGDLLVTQLPFALRDFIPSAQGTRQYKGPVPDAVARFISKLPVHERSLAKSYREDLADYIVDEVIAAVARSLFLVRFVVQYPHASLSRLVESFPWNEGLKRDTIWKEARIALLLRSISAAGISLPIIIERPNGSCNEQAFSLNAVAFATSTNRIERSWLDFKRKNGLGKCAFDLGRSNYYQKLGLGRPEYGMARSIDAEATFNPDREASSDLHILGESLGGQLTCLAEEIHDENPKAGFKLIAWHSVFWRILSEYEGLRLNLQVFDPFCETDQELAQCISNNYEEVTSTSRPVVSRRRQRLYTACIMRIGEQLRKRFGA